MPFSAHVLHVSFILVDTEDHCHLVSIDLVSGGLLTSQEKGSCLKKALLNFGLAIPSRVDGYPISC